MSLRILGRVLILAGLLVRSAFGQSEITAVEVTPDGRTALVAAMDGKVRIWDVATRKQRLDVVAHKKGVWDLSLSADGKRFITGGGDRVARVWDVTTMKEIQTLEGHDKEVAAVALSPDGQWAATAGYDPVIRLWDAKTGKLRRCLEGHQYRVTALAFSPDGKKLASGGIAQADVGGLRGSTQADRIRLWDIPSGSGEQLSLRGQRLLFTPDGRALAAAGMYLDVTPMAGGFSVDGGSRTQVWDLRRKRFVATFMQRWNGLAVSADGKYLATSWGHNRHSGGLIISGSDAQGIHLYELATGKEAMQIKLPQKEVIALALTVDGRTAIAGRSDGQVVFHDLKPAGWTVPKWSDAIGERAWKDLADRDAGKAYRAVYDLSAGGDEAVALVRKRVKPTRLSAERVRRLIAELDSDEGATRKRAREALGELGEQAQEYLEEAVQKTTSSEVRRSVRSLLSTLERVGLTADGLRANRAVVVLERIGTSAAKKVLQTLAGGTPGLPLTEDARRALIRLDRRNR